MAIIDVSNLPMFSYWYGQYDEDKDEVLEVLMRRYETLINDDAFRNYTWSKP